MFGPYTPLQQLDLLADSGTKSYVVGSTNSLLLQQKDRYSDILINVWHLPFPRVLKSSSSNKPASLTKILLIFYLPLSGTHSPFPQRTGAGSIS